MCPHLPPYAECVILYSLILHQCRFALHTAKTRSQDGSEVVYNYLLQCISLWRGIHAGGGARGGGGGGVRKIALEESGVNEEHGG